MICKECLIWQRRDTDLIRQIKELVPAFIKLEIFDNELASNQAKTLDRAWRDNIQFMDDKCSEGYCRLILGG